MSIVKLKTLYVASDAVAACVDFYTAALGFEIRFRDADRWVQLAGYSIPFAVACPDEAPTGARGAIPVFESDAAGDHDRLLAAGATMLDERDMGSHGRTRTYRDPADNLLQLFWRSEA